MKKYWTIIQTFWQRALTYRFTVAAYRLGETIEILVQIVLWTAIFQQTNILGGMTLNEMITYILIGNLFRVMVRNFLPDVIERDIKDGKLSLYLVRPIEYFNFILTKEIGRISVATFMSISTQLILVIFFINKLSFNFDPLYLTVILIMIILAFLAELLLAYLVGMIAFWTDEAEGLYHSIDTIKRFFAGNYFPLSLLPIGFVNISLMLPFAYSFFVPTQLYLKKIDLMTGIQGLIIQVGWIVILYGISQIVWKMGLKRYEGVGI